MKKFLFVLALVVFMSALMNTYAQNANQQCITPLVPYQGACVDPIPACKNPPVNHMPSSCIDKIENGVYVERFNFSCMPGYDPVGKECVKNDDMVDDDDGVDAEDLAPDLTIGIRHIQLVKSKAIKVRRFKISLVVSNNGSDDAEGNIWMSFAKEGTVSNVNKLLTRRGIKAGKHLYTTLYVAYENKNTNFVFVVDPKNEIEESNEENNAVTNLITGEMK